MRTFCTVYVIFWMIHILQFWNDSEKYCQGHYGPWSGLTNQQFIRTLFANLCLEVRRISSHATFQQVMQPLLVRKLSLMFCNIAYSHTVFRSSNLSQAGKLLFQRFEPIFLGQINSEILQYKNSENICRNSL